MTDIFLNYGVLGVSVIAMAGYIMFLHKEARKDREETRKEFSAALHKNTEAINNNTNLIYRLIGMLDNIKE